MYRILLLTIIVLTSVFSCTKEEYITTPDARIQTVDSLHFDTVFTSRGSVTKSFTVVNVNAQKLRLSTIRLAGGSVSPFTINVNGAPGTTFSNLELEPGDSLYVFVKVTIDPNNSQQPFLVKDSIAVEFNGQVQQVQLRAFGQNARFITQATIGSNTTWNNQLPYVIVNPLTVAPGVTLTLLEGTRVYFNAGAPLVVNGSLQALGDKYDSTRIYFRGDRLDAEYSDLPGSWPGIVFSPASTANLMRYAHVLNAYQSLIVAGGANLSPAKLTLQNCMIDNAYDVGLYAINTSINASSTLISQCGNDGEPGMGGSNVIVAGGGNYQFSHCTMVTYANYYQNHKQAVLHLSNSANGQADALNATFTNCIIFGQGGSAADEVMTSVAGTAPFQVAMRNVLYKAKNTPAGITFTNSILNEDPQFDSVNTSLRKYNFRLRDYSPCLDKGLATAPGADLDGNPRPVGTAPDMGCYERQ